MALPNKIVVDFTNTKDRSGVNPIHQDPGDYRGVLKSVEHTIAQTENKTKQLVYIIGDADRPSATYRYNCPLTENSLWKIRNLLIAAGIEVPKKRLNIAAIAERILGREIGMALDDDEYQGRLRSQVVNVFPVKDLPDDESTPADVEDEDEDEDDDDEVEEEPTPRRTRKAAAAPAKKAPAKKAPARKTRKAEVEEEEDEDEDLDELDVDEL